MNWKMKALMHWILSYCPYGNEIQYWIQKNVTKTLPRPSYRLENGLMHATNHTRSFWRYSDRDIETASIYEFGAGADMYVQLLLYSYGFNRQITVDLNRLLKAELVNDSINKIREMGLNSLPRIPDKFLGNGDTVNELKKFYGIDYRAPFDARKTGLPDDSVDLIVSSETVQFIPIDDLTKILAECRRILKPEGILSLSINCDDIYGYVDPSISTYNFLRYSEFTWRFYNPPKHFQNRLRHWDYLALAKRVGFEVLEDNFVPVTKDELKILKKIKLHPKFREYPFEDLAIRIAHFVLRKK